MVELHVEHAFGDLLREIKAHGFESLRGTTHGVLYGFKEFRISFPTTIKEATRGFALSGKQKEWEALKRRVYAQYPGVKFRVEKRLAHARNGDRPSDVEGLVPIMTLEDSLPSVDVPVVDKATGEPVPMPTEAAVGDGKKKRSSPIFRPCPVPGCAQKATGKHNEWHRRRGEWRPEYDPTNAATKKAYRDRKVPQPEPEKPANLGAVTTALAAAFAKIEEGMEMARKAVSALAYERDTYKEQLRQQAEVIQRADAAFSALRKRPPTR